MDRKVRASFLLSFYGGLLSQRRREYMALHFDEDMSLAEIAEQYGISRQAVLDAISRGEKQLEQMESALGMLQKYMLMLKEIDEISRELDGRAAECGCDLSGISERLNRLPDILGG
ncbi:MAG: sigma factor-like helix-turn-helix DNA-binding protein [Christensenellales bacterium]|jgi:predicted DNA-binding protein YlxM (UPF0122 family)